MFIYPLIYQIPHTSEYIPAGTSCDDVGTGARLFLFKRRVKSVFSSSSGDTKPWLSAPTCVLSVTPVWPLDASAGEFDGPGTTIISISVAACSWFEASLSWVWELPLFICSVIRPVVLGVGVCISPESDLEFRPIVYRKKDESNVSY